MNIHKTIVWNAIRINYEFLIQIKIVVYVILDFMMMEKMSFANLATILGIIVYLF